MAEMGKPKNARSGKGGDKAARKGVGVGKKLAGDTKAKAQHGTQLGGGGGTPRKDSPRIPTGRAGGKAGGAKAGR